MEIVKKFEDGSAIAMSACPKDTPGEYMVTVICMIHLKSYVEPARILPDAVKAATELIERMR